MRVRGAEISERQLDLAWAAQVIRQERTYQDLVGFLHGQGVSWDAAWRAADRLLQKKRRVGIIEYEGKRRWRLLKQAEVQL